MAVRVESGTLRAVLAGVFQALGVPRGYAEVTADALVYANLRCVDSHGVSRGLDYVEGIRRGEINPRPEVRVVRESAASVLLDGDGGIGPPVALSASLAAIGKARGVGVAVAAARNLRDVGALGYYVSRIASEGYVGIAMANARARVSLPGVRSPIVGTNPIAIGIPSKRRRILLDMALSVVSYGRILLAARSGSPIPEGWAVARDGRPTTDPAEAKDGYLLPIGGYKGLALAMMVDMLAGPLIGAPPSLRISGGGPYTQGGFLAIAVDPALFRDPEELERDLEEYAQMIGSLPRDGSAEVVVPGEKASRCLEERLLHGVPLDAETFGRLVGVADELGVETGVLTGREARGTGGPRA